MKSALCCSGGILSFPLMLHDALAAGSDMPVAPRSFPMDLIRILLSILLPPVGVFLQVGIGLQFWINILLTLLGYIPGVVHAVYIIATRD